MSLRNNQIQNLLYDKVTFTHYIPEDEREVVIDRINDPMVYGKYNRKVFGTGSSSGRYNNNYQFDMTEDKDESKSIFLSLYPKNKNNNFLRVEYSPYNLRKDGRKELRLFLINLITVDLVKLIYFNARVTRLDLTLDVFDMEPNIYIHKNIVKCSEIIRDEETDRLATQIIGSDASDCRVTMYDKSLEQGHETSEGGGNHQRIEIRLRNLSNTMDQLSDELLVEFEKLNFFTGGFLHDKQFSAEFCKNAYDNGLNTALYELHDDNLRRRYRRYLESYRAYPISMAGADLNFDKAHQQALKSLISRKYQAEVLS
ncbi:MAG: hypothetical protein NTX38_11255 [Methylobacter sp.]|nr:hypothetical protein [Methylobacter sp.]